MEMGLYSISAQNNTPNLIQRDAIARGNIKVYYQFNCDRPSERNHPYLISQQLNESGSHWRQKKTPSVQPSSCLQISNYRDM